MNVTINGVPKTYPAPLSVQDALKQEGYADLKVAVARNGAFLPRGAYANTNIEDGDEIEIVAPMQGG